MANIKVDMRSALRQLKAKLGSNLVAVIQFGSSLHPAEMFSNSDMDLLVIVKRKPGEQFLNIRTGIETNILLYPRRQFEKELRDGHPILLMALRFGSIILGKQFLASKSAAVTSKTAGFWLETGLRAYSMAIMEFFSTSCVCCYLMYAHHAARSFLRALALKNKGLLCETDADIIANTEDGELRAVFEKLIAFRRTLNDFPWDPMRRFRLRGIKGRSAQPLLMLESLVHKIVWMTGHRHIWSLSDIISKIKEQHDHIHSIYLHTGKQPSYAVCIVLNKPEKGKEYNPGMRFLNFPFYK